MSALYLDTMSADIFRQSIQGLTFSPSISLSVEIRSTDTSNPTYDPATAITSYPESVATVTAFRGTVTRDEGEDVRKGDVWFAINPSDSQPLVGDRIVADGTAWYIYKVGNPDPTTSLVWVYTRRSPS